MQVIAVHIDNGYMRKAESANVATSLASVGLTVQVISANMEFMNSHTFLEDKKSVLLCHTTDPEVKRKIIGDTFMNVANRIIEEMSLDPDKVMFWISQSQSLCSLIYECLHVSMNIFSGLHEAAGLPF